MKASEIDLDQILHPKPEAGRLELQAGRAVIADTDAAFRLAEELEETLGREAARGVLTRYGYQAGYRDATRLRNYFDWDSDVEWLRAAARTQTLLGVGSVEFDELVLDRTEGLFRVRLTVRDSYEASEHRRMRGPAEDAVCDRLTGYFTGFGSAFLGDDVLFVETECAATSEDRAAVCRLEGQLATEWGATGARHKDLYERDAIGERLESLDREVLAQAVKIQEQELILEAQRKVEEASRLRTEFMANISHELRTPLNSIIGYADLLLAKLGKKLPQTPRLNLERILANANDLLTLINEILDISKIEAGRLELHYEPIELREVLVRSAEDAQVLLKDKPVELVLSGESAVPPVRVDRSRFEQCLRNVLSNAAKFTEQGQIAIDSRQLTVQKGGRNVSMVAVAIKDTGPGIPADKQELIFEPFRQADASTTRHHGGTGLGLPIVRELLELMGGEVRVTSELGAGSTFTLIVPTAEQEAEEAPEKDTASAEQEAEEEASSRYILMLDDDADFCRIVEEAVQERPPLADYEFRSRQDPVQAIAQARVTPPALLILDLRLPQVDGREVLRLLRRDERTSDVPVIVVSVRDDARATVADGAATALSKPVAREELLAAVERALGVEAET